MRRMKDKIEGTITNADSALAVENLSASVDVASSGQSADITLSSLTKAKAKLSVAVTGVATMAKKGTTDLTIDVPNQNDLLNALTNNEIDAITGGMVDDDGNPIKPNEVIVDASLTVSGRAADAKVTGTRISEALSIAKSADAGLTNVRTELDKLKLDSVAVDKTLTKENFAADAKVVGDALAGKADKSIVQDESGNVIFYSKAIVDKLLAGKLGLHDTADNSQKLDGYELRLSDHPGSANILVQTVDEDGRTCIDCRNDASIGLTAIVASGVGYVRFGDGTQICWGEIAQPDVKANSTVAATITYPVAFVSGHAPEVSLTIAGNSENNAYSRLVLHTTSRTATNCIIYFKNSASVQMSPIAQWIAIGRWK